VGNYIGDKNMNIEKINNIDKKYNSPYYVYTKFYLNTGLVDIDICKHEKEEVLGGYWDNMRFPAIPEDFKTYAILHKSKVDFYRNFCQWLFGAKI